MLTKHIIYTILKVPNQTNVKFDTERGNSMNNKVYGYCRISTASQSILRQIRNIKAEYPKAFIVEETFTGTDFESRKELQKLLNKVKPGNTIVFDSVSRLSRDAETGFKLYQELFDKGVKVTINTDNLTLSDTTLKREIEKSQNYYGLTSEEIKKMQLYAIDSAFLTKKEKAELINEWF